jgi:predicted amidophosphoribosyltransferase
VKLFEVHRFGGSIPAFAIAEYRGHTAEIINVIKRRGIRRPIGFVAQQLFVPALQRIGLASAEVSAVPASRSGKRTRGFDHMERITRASGYAYHRVFRHRAAGQQKRLDKIGREKNARAALELCMIPPPGTVVLDDVLTTGATIDRACELLGEVAAPPAAALVLATEL